MRNMLKKWSLSILTAVFVLTVFTPLQTVYAATLTSPATNITAATDTSTRDWTGSNITSASASEGYVSMTVEGGSHLSKQGYLTLTYTGNAKAVLSFSISTTGTFSSLKVGGNTAGSSYSAELTSGQSVAIYLTVSSKNTATVTLSGLTCQEILEGPATITYNDYISSASVGGTAVENGGTSATIGEAGAELKATPASDATFVAWVNAENNMILSQDATFTLKPYATSMKIKAIGTKPEQPAYYKVGTTLFTDLAAAITTATSGADKVIVVIGDGTVQKGAYTIPSGVTLLTPFSKTDLTIDSATYTDDSGALASTLEKANAAFVSDRADDSTGNDSIKNILEPDTSVTYTLTVPSDVTINVAGDFVVGGTIVAGSYATQGLCGATAGAHSNIQLEGTLNINSGGILSCCGYIRGDGTINTASGGTVYQPYIIMDHKDGHYVSGAKDEGCFPFYRQSLLNIQSELVMNFGSDLYGYVTFFTQEQLSGTFPARYNVTCMHLVGSGSENALFLLGEKSSMAITYDPTKTLNVTSNANNIKRGYYSKVGRTTMSFSGDVALGYMTMSITVLGSNYDVSTEKAILPLSYNYNLVQESGIFSANYNLALLPGVTFTVEEGAALTIAEGVDFAVYDGFRDYSIRSETVTLDGTGSSGTWAQFHYPSSADLLSYGFSSTAELIVNGTLNVNGNLGGTVQTTDTTGKIIMGSGAGESVTSVLGVQNESSTITIPLVGSFDFLGSCGKSTRTLYPKVFTADGTHLTMEAGKTYEAIGSTENKINNYTYSVYATHDAAAPTEESKSDLNATVVGIWCSHSVDGDYTCPGCDGVYVAKVNNGDPLFYEEMETVLSETTTESTTTIQILNDLGEEQSLNVNGTVTLDLFGNDVMEHNITGTLTVIDSATDGFDGSKAGSISGTYSGISTIETGKKYLAISNSTSTSFHRVAASFNAYRVDSVGGALYMTVQGTFRGTETAAGYLSSMGFVIDGTEYLYTDKDGNVAVPTHTGQYAYINYSFATAIGNAYTALCRVMLNGQTLDSIAHTTLEIPEL